MFLWVFYWSNAMNKLFPLGYSSKCSKFESSSLKFYHITEGTVNSKINGTPKVFTCSFRIYILF